MQGTTVVDVLNWATERFKAHRVQNPRLNAELLLAHSLHLSREGLYLQLHDVFEETQKRAVEALVGRRLAGEPLQYILGHQEFWSIGLRVDRRVLIPRSDTETLVEQALGALETMISEQIPVVLDLGTGSGAIAIALAADVERIFLVATDLSADAVQLARLNSQKAGVSGKIAFLIGDLLKPFRFLEGKEPFDLVLSNPPYILRSEIGTLDKEVKDFEPVLALDGGEDGLDFHREIISQGSRVLRRGGWLLLEVGQGQAVEVSRMVERSGSFQAVERIRDLSGTERVVKAQKRC